MSSSNGKCQDPAKCQLSLEISSALKEFSLPHNCSFEEAKRLLLDKIVSTALDSTSSNITAILKDELKKWESETHGTRS
ncbi:hypothetical protein SMACR_09621 [Sordaria macrospora]|uniref:WGS project CABT00000000 data, contig 2.129 n=2 Tax=Sordaria macrospora TaxID=5147 RepID=F7WCG1_SORMK|nr:uncharacterized protein SMAC_09621 [Sordaria macrospora k-hell]KAA8635576.1 hypothetical protein SMACR_09621 [Sordaria macrospora]KAH7629456.1 hypothetical protein B0T09DRAFT_266653 [Sordaria sp. MPI-SDFR-AT-0083]WPJ66321.1 hypothetical protein SMAC4_09621 [Sordaria macrospora]CCC14593.1 unnamed protein product [Sordaria macrospora k-hell]